MSRLADIYKSEKKSGGGILSSVGKRALEKIDPRQLFDQSGVLAAMAPTLFKKYSATSMKTGKLALSPTPPLSPTPQTPLPDAKMDLIIKQNQDVITNTKISAKNSLMFPGMARDMNVMRQNMVKMVKLQGGTAATKADMFFKTAKEREAEYEVNFQKDRPVSPTPTVSKGKTEKTGGLFGMLSGLLPAILSGIGTLGGKIISSITGAITGLGSLILQGITSALSIPNLMKAFGVVTEALGGILKLATMVATNPLFLAMASITGVAALLAFLRADYDKDKARYMDLALKKKEKGSLTESEQKELEKLERPAFRTESIRSFGFDPKTGKEVDRNTTIEELNVKSQSETQRILQPGTAKEYLKAGEEFYKSEGYTRQQLELMAAGKKVDLSQPSGVTPVQPPASAPATTPAPSSQAPYNAAQDSQAASAAAAATATKPVQTPSTTPESMKGYKSRTPAQVSSTDYNETVAKTESGGKYDTVYGKAGGAMINGKPVTQNTIGEVIEWQKKNKASNRHAAGKYQFINVEDAAKNAGLSTEALFDSVNQEIMQKAFTERNAKSLERKGIEATNENLALAHAVGAGGAAALLKAQESGQGNLLAADVLGLKDSSRTTNPQLMRPVSEVISASNSRFASSPATSAPMAPPVTLAAAPAPTLTAAAPTRPSSIISDSTVALAEVKERTSSAPIVVNAPQTVNNMQQGSQAVTQYTAPSIVDSEFMRMLVSRAV
jgi:hypothetical protein